MPFAMLRLKAVEKKSVLDVRLKVIIGLPKVIAEILILLPGHYSR